MHETLANVDLTDVPTGIKNRFASLVGTVTYGTRSFPTPEQYWEAVQGAYEAGVADFAVLAALAQLDWHRRGQTGCQFARLAAIDASALRWDHLIVSAHSSLNASAFVQMEAWIQAGVRDPHVEVLSIVWPDLQNPDDVVQMISNLVQSTGFWLEKDAVHDGHRHLHLRYPVAQGVHAWAMAFAPFGFLPNTRRGPFMEIVVRAKEKPARIFHRLNQDRDIAHLADVPIDMSDTRWEHRWQGTLQRTRMVLGGEPDYISAAKATIVVPVVQDID